MSHSELSRLIDLPTFDDPRGSLTVCEFERQVPFAVERSFIVHGVPAGVERGEHAHRACHQFLLCVHGTVKALADDGSTRTVFDLAGPSRGLYMPPLTWGGQFDYSADALLVVFASHRYDDADYVRDYSTFLQLVTNRR